MSLQFSVSKNGPPNNTNKINKRITEYKDTFVGKVLKGRPKTYEGLFYSDWYEKKLTI